MPPRPCLICGTPTTSGPRCAQHAITWAPTQSAAQRGYGGDWTQISKRMRADHPWCERCGAITDLTVDHITPLAQGGTHHPTNLRVLCRSCNTRRAVKHTA